MTASNEHPKEDFNILPIIGLVIGSLCLCNICLIGIFGTSIFALAARATAIVQTQVVPSVTAAAQANATATAQAQWPLVIDSTFELNLRAWPTGSHDSASYGSILRRVVDGKYVWEVEAKKGVHWYAYPDMLPVSDFLLTAEVKQLSGQANANYGVVFREADNHDRYYFAIRDTGEFYFALWTRGQWQILIGWT